MALKRDLKFALRMQMKKPGFTAVAVLTLALGIGANTAIFSLVNATFLKSLPYGSPDRLMLLFEATKRGWYPVAYPNFIDWRDMNRSFDDLACYRPTQRVLLGGPVAEKVSCKLVPATFLPTLGVRPILGRNFTAAEDSVGGEKVVMLDYAFWHERFGGNPDVLGRSLNIDGEAFTVVGVLPSCFRFQGDAKLYFPIHPTAHQEARYDHNALTVVGRLRPDVTQEQAQAEMTVVAKQLEERYPKENAGDGIALMPLTQWVTGYTRTLVLVFAAAVAFVLLIACVNVAGLLLVRVNERSRELAVRAAMGADRRSLVGQTLVESLLLALQGGALGLLVATVALSSLRNFVPEEVAAAVQIDGWVLLFTVLLSCGTAALFGAIPGLKSSRANVNELLKESERSGTGTRHSRFRDLLVVSEIALALILLIGAGLMIRSAVHLTKIDPGFKSEGVVTMKIEPPDSRFFAGARSEKGVDFDKVVRNVGNYTKQVLERARSIPGVENAASVFPLLMSGNTATFPIAPEGMPAPAEGNYRAAHRYSITGDYFKVMGIPLVKGRTFSERDDAEAPKVAIVSERMAREFWPGIDPIGRVFRIPNFEDKVFTVVGVVGDTRHDSPQAPIPPQLYLSQLQWPGSITLLLRTTLPAERMAEAMREQMAGFDREAPVTEVVGLKEHVARNGTHGRQVTLLLSIFAGVALLLAIVGIYGVMSHSVAQRTRELGLRIAIGASPSLVLKMVLRRALVLSLVGVGLGIAGAVVLTRWLGTWLHGVSPTDPLTYAAISALITVVAFASTYRPARRAASVDPMTALRCE